MASGVRLDNAKRILIVDDLPELRKLIGAFLEEELGFRVCGEATDGLDAIEKAKDLTPDLIILDLSMPRMNGLEAAPRLKKILPKTPIILFTEHEALMQGLDPREMWVDAVVPKDRGMSSLGERVASLL
jgi:CheY-like chemotaxis protein